MKALYDNPYDVNTAEYQIWNVLIKNDFEAFLTQNWEMIENDFIQESFFGIDMAKSTTPESWKIGFPTLDAYKEKWIKDSVEFSTNKFINNPREVLYSTTTLTNFDFNGDSVLVQKVFNGVIYVEDKDPIELKWRSLFLLKNVGTWKIAGFCGYIHN